MCFLFILEDHGETERQKIGLFSACSEITGVLNEDLNLTALLHHHNALCFWDYSTVAHCAAIDMNPEVQVQRIVMAIASSTY